MTFGASLRPKVEMSSEVLLTISRNEAERLRLESEYKAEVDLQSKLGGAKREGRMEMGREVARSALAEGIPVDLVRKITGLDLETIKSLEAQG